MTQPVSGPLAILTGGSTGIGHYLVGALARAGYAVAFSYRSSPDAAQASVQALEAQGLTSLALPCDVGIKAQVEAFVAQAVAWAGAVPTLLVNNAGIQTWSPLLDLDEERWDDVIRTNLKGCFLHTQIVGRLMADAGQGGSIINIGSGCNKLAFPNLVDYTASKGGIEQFTKSAAVELGRYGITVNCVAPGAIATERTAEEAPDYAATWAPITPLGRVGTPEDLLGAVLFFAGAGSRFVTGQTLWVDGGVFTRAAWPYAQ
ncbi:SDR family oxidoreductase [Novosphingobium sediminicola]|uniref:NAD(P)-dependent dehydrogenase (Short-subunit alcohol dehydrogenase family) n=1 Tax=Novosphingobium sediminicola TaxID=563162 RepID=A0A7W6CEQ0_9SPHN|nr:NAD(P)-dependent dehydrogenase (short-subunit alcohol dehydrogenase family) [Novosphingobium sediminicola]